MRRVGIVTLTGNKNYGNKLQNYALAKVIENYGFDVYTLWCNETFFTKSLKKYKNILLSPFDIDSKRKKKFTKFNSKYLKCYYVNSKKIDKLNRCFSYYVIGSDQIWNPNIINRYLGVSILGKGHNVFSYAASIGVSNIDDKYSKIIKEKFIKENIKYVSVREKDAQKIVEKNTGRKDIDVLIDPTLLLSAEQWNEIISEPKNLKNKKYILTYFLGGISDSRKKSIDDFAKKNGCIIINLLDKNDPYYTSDPSEFLYLEKNAYLICTDSFHSSVFGLIYDRPFVIFDRDNSKKENMSSRLTNFVDTFKLDNRMFNEKSITQENLNHDYTEAYKILVKERKKSICFIEKALEINKEGVSCEK